MNFFNAYLVTFTELLMENFFFSTAIETNLDLLTDSKPLPCMPPELCP